MVVGFQTFLLTAGDPPPDAVGPAKVDAVRRVTLGPLPVTGAEGASEVVNGVDDHAVQVVIVGVVVVVSRGAHGDVAALAVGVAHELSFLASNVTCFDGLVHRRWVRCVIYPHYVCDLQSISRIGRWAIECPAGGPSQNHLFSQVSKHS